MAKTVRYAVAADALHFAQTGDEYRVRDATAVERAAWPRDPSPQCPHLRTVVRRADGASVTYACQDRNAFGDMCDEELMSFDADLDAAAEPA